MLSDVAQGIAWAASLALLIFGQPRPPAPPEAPAITRTVT